MGPSRTTSHVKAARLDRGLAQGEIDPALTNKVVLLADRRDGQPLGPNEGPLRLVVPDEKGQGRWVRQVEAIDVVQAQP